MSGSKKSKKGALGEGKDGRISREQQLEHVACRSIIMRLADLGPGLQSPDTLPRFLDVVRQTYRPAQRRDLEGILTLESAYDTYGASAFVYADKVPRGVPVLWPVLAFEADRASQRLKIRAALFHEDVEFGGARPRAVAWRFEPPEGPDSAHSYFHAQPILAWERDSDNLPVWAVNDNYPAFPLMAGDSIGLLTAVLVSLYGRRNTRELLGDSQIQDSITPIRKRLVQWL